MYAAKFLTTPLKFLNHTKNFQPPPSRKFLNSPSKISQPILKISQPPPPKNFSTRPKISQPPPKNFSPPPKISQPPPRKFLNPPQKISQPPTQKFLNPPENISTPKSMLTIYTPPPIPFIFSLFLPTSFPSLFKKKSENFCGLNPPP